MPTDYLERRRREWTATDKAGRLERATYSRDATDFRARLAELPCPIDPSSLREGPSDEDSFAMFGELSRSDLVRAIQKAASTAQTSDHEADGVYSW